MLSSFSVPEVLFAASYVRVAAAVASLWGFSSLGCSVQICRALWKPLANYVSYAACVCCMDISIDGISQAGLWLTWLKGRQKNKGVQEQRWDKSFWNLWEITTCSRVRMKRPIFIVNIIFHSVFYVFTITRCINVAQKYHHQIVIMTSHLVFEP